jgi:hypothetical protein
MSVSVSKPSSRRAQDTRGAPLRASWPARNQKSLDIAVDRRHFVLAKCEAAIAALGDLFAGARVRESTGIRHKDARLAWHIGT